LAFELLEEGECFSEELFVVEATKRACSCRVECFVGEPELRGSWRGAHGHERDGDGSVFGFPVVVEDGSVL
jgi:hypothetical protein